MPRRRPACLVLPLGVLAATLGASAVFGQTASSPMNVLRPTFDGDQNVLPAFRRPGDNRGVTGSTRQTLGNPPASGAGNTGFDSSNNPRRQPAARRAAPTSGVAEPGPGPARVATTRAAVGDPERAAFLEPQLPVTRRRPLNATDRAVTYVTQPVPPRGRPLAEVDPFAPVGIRAGAFVLRPALEVTGAYDTNPERTSSQPRGSLYTVVAPELQVRSDWVRHELSASLRGTYSAYEKDFVPSLDRPAFNGIVNGRVDVTRQTRLDLEGRLIVGTDNPGSPNIQAGTLKVPIFTAVGGTAGIGHRFNRLEIGLRGSVDRTAYGESELTNGTTQNNDSRNYNQYGGQGRIGYEVLPWFRPFVSLEGDSRVHDLPVDTSGFARDSNGIAPRVGVAIDLTRELFGEVSIGYVTRTYQDPRLEDVKGLLIDGSLVWTATGLTTVSFNARSRVAESDVPGVSGSLTRDVGLQVDHAFRRWLIGTLRIGHGIDDYVGLDRLDRRYSVSAIMTYKMTRTVQIKGEIRQDWLRSNVPSADYTATAFLVGFRLQR